MPMIVLDGPHGTWKGGLFPVSENDGPDCRQNQCQADAENKYGDWAKRPAARVLRLLLTLPATSLLR